MQGLDIKKLVDSVLLLVRHWGILKTSYGEEHLFDIYKQIIEFSFGSNLHCFKHFSSFADLVVVWLDCDDVSMRNKYSGIISQIYANHTVRYPFENLIRKLQYFDYMLAEDICIIDDNTELLDYNIEIDEDSYMRILSFINSNKYVSLQDTFI